MCSFSKNLDRIVLPDYTGHATWVPCESNTFRVINYEWYKQCWSVVGVTFHLPLAQKFCTTTGEIYTENENVMFKCPMMYGFHFLYLFLVFNVNKITQPMSDAGKTVIK